MGMTVFGIILAIPGAVLPFVIEKFSIDMVEAGTLFLTLTSGILVGSLVFGPVVDRYGYKRLLILCILLVFTGIEGIAFSTSAGFLRISLFITGFAGGSINGGTNALVSDTFEDSRGARLSLLAVFFGAGALGVPLVLGILLDLFAYESLIAFIGVLVLIPLILLTAVRFPAPKHEQGFPVAEGWKLAKETNLLLFGLILFMHSGLEMIMGGWSATFLSRELHIHPRHSVLYLSFFWLGLILARLAVSKILHHVSRHKVMLVSFSVALVGAAMLLVSRGLVMAIPGLLLTGIGLAAVFPLIFAYVGDLYPKFSGTAFGVILVISLPGGMIYPYLSGLIAQHFNLRLSLLMVPVTLACSFFLFLKIKRKISKTPQLNK
jgi:MFS transporter, FHS family, glucose/mannose:H+ symporter